MSNCAPSSFSSAILSLLAAAWIATASPGFAADSPVEFKIPLHAEVIGIPVTIDGAEHLCLIDSGASQCSFHSSLRKLLGKPIGRETWDDANGGRFKVDLFSPPIAKIGSIELSREPPVACNDISLLGEATGRNFEGVLGMPLFRANIIQMDFDGQQLLIWQKLSKPNVDWGKPVDVSFTKLGLPIIDVTLGGQIETKCIVDTGFNKSLALASDVFVKLSENRIITRPEDSAGVGATGVRGSRDGTLSTIKVGDFENKGLLVSESGKDSLIGLEYLRRFRVTFDLGNSRMYLAKAKGFDNPDKLPLGIGMLKRNGKTTVAFVRHNSGAEKAGIRVNDELISIAGVQVTDQSLGEIKWLIREKADSAGITVLGFRRGASERTISLSIPK